MRTLLFYDLETTGFNAATDRIMQFAAIRTDEELNQIGEPVNLLVKLSNDILPSPFALDVTGITPQQTVREGISEPEFCKYLMSEVFTPDTTIIGFNNIRFDDEFMRHTLWRNFYDPYEWAWKDGRNRWDMLDVARMIRALRPGEIKWPFKTREDGAVAPVNNLEGLASENGIVPEKMHDALSDITTLIALTKLFKEKQPKLFNFLYNWRSKEQVKKIAHLNKPEPFVYTSGNYSSKTQHTTVAYPIGAGSNDSTILVYDLAVDPTQFLDQAKWTETEYKKAIKNKYVPYKVRKEKNLFVLPVKELNYGKCPAVAPISVLDSDTASRLGLNMEHINDIIAKIDNFRPAFELMTKAWNDKTPYTKSVDVEKQLYSHFTPNEDRPLINKISQMSEAELDKLTPVFLDSRLPELFLRYKARNYPNTLTIDEVTKWEEYRQAALLERKDKFDAELAAVKRKTNNPTLIEDLQLWADELDLNHLVQAEPIVAHQTEQDFTMPF